MGSDRHRQRAAKFRGCLEGAAWVCPHLRESSKKDEEAERLKPQLRGILSNRGRGPQECCLGCKRLVLADSAAGAGMRGGVRLGSIDPHGMGSELEVILRSGPGHLGSFL